jgi:hypothetical protein
MRCESACDCELNFKRGDYHLGRACRLRRKAILNCDESKIEPVISRRLVSLTKQTTEILRDKVNNAVRKIVDPRMRSLQSKVCEDLLRLHDHVDGHCLPQGQLPVRTIQERIFCRDIDFSVCRSPESEPSPGIEHRRNAM